VLRRSFEHRDRSRAGRQQRADRRDRPHVLALRLERLGQRAGAAVLGQHLEFSRRRVAQLEQRHAVGVNRDELGSECLPLGDVGNGDLIDGAILVVRQGAGGDQGEGKTESGGFHWLDPFV
jgi:hypothetical protein